MKKQTTTLRRRRFERIVVLVDITVVLLQLEPKKTYAAHIFNAVSRILQQCNEHNNFVTMWGYKFFDPCQSHIIARSKVGEYLGGTPMFERFDAVAPNLEKFGKVLNLMVNNHRQYSSGQVRGEYIASAISEVSRGTEYPWDPLLASDSSSSDEESNGLPATKDWLGGDGAKRDSNVIILFSSVPTSFADVNCFFKVRQPGGDGSSDRVLLLTEKFRKAQEALKSNNIQVCFVDVPRHQDLWSDERLETVLKPTPTRNLVLKSLSGLVKTVLASELLLVGPTLVPCNLVWNTMADLGIDKSRKRSYALVFCDESTLLCDVQLQPFSVVRTPTSKGMSPLKPKLLPASDKLDIVLNSVLPKSSLNMRLGSERFLVQRSSRPKAPLSGEDRDAVGDQVLQLLDQNAFRPGQPGWQLLLLSLASQNSVCEVSLRCQENGHCLKALLEPFTAVSAILTVFEKEVMPANTDMHGPTRIDRLASMNADTKNGSVSAEGVKVKYRKDVPDYSKHEGVTVLPSRKRRKVAARNVEPVFNWQEYWEGEASIPASTEWISHCSTVMSRYVEGGKASHLLQTMDSFLKEMAQPSRLNPGSEGSLVVTVEEVESSSRKSSVPVSYPDGDGVALPGTVSVQNSVALVSNDIHLPEFSEPLALVEVEIQLGRNAGVYVEAPAQEEDPAPSLVLQMTSEEAKEYISSVGLKVEDCLSDYASYTDVDRVRFAGMLVAESQKSFYVLARQPKDDQQRSVASEQSTPDLNRQIASKLKKLLLISPKKLLAKYKDCPTGCPNVDEKMKEYELQILLRLEMIALDEGRLLGHIAKDQLVEDVCNLLDSIQFYLDGGIFGGQGLSKYCDGLLVRRYDDTIPSTISKIFSIMELDGYSGHSPPNSGPESLSDVSLKVPPRIGDLLLNEAGVSQDSIHSSEIMSSSATGDTQFSSRDSASLPTSEKRSKRKKGLDDSSLQVQSNVLEKGQRKKGSYHFASRASSLTRKFKYRARHTAMHSKLPNRRGKPSVLGHDDPVQIVCQTPAPVTALSCLRADELTQPATFAPPMELTACSPTHERVSVDQSPGVLEGTPFVIRKLTLQNVSRESRRRSENALDERLAAINRTFDAGPNLPPSSPSKMRRSSFELETCKRSVLSRDSPSKKQGVVNGPLSFSALLKCVVTSPPKMEEAGNSGSNLGSHLLRDDYDNDDIDDDDEEGIISTPFKVNASDQSLLSLQSSQSGHPDCHKQLDLFTSENTRDSISLPHSLTVDSSRPFLPTGLQYATAVVDTGMNQKGGSLEVTHLPEHDSSSRSSPETGCLVHSKALRKDSCPQDVALGKVLKELLHFSVLVPRNPLGTISTNSAQRASMNECSSVELLSVSDTAAGDAPGNHHGDELASGMVLDKENHSSVWPRKKSTNLRSGLACIDVCERKTRSRSLLEQNMSRGAAVNTRRGGRIP